MRIAIAWMSGAALLAACQAVDVDMVHQETPVATEGTTTLAEAGKTKPSLDGRQIIEMAHQASFHGFPELYTMARAEISRTQGCPWKGSPIQGNRPRLKTDAPYGIRLSARCRSLHDVAEPRLTNDDTS